MRVLFLALLTTLAATAVADDFLGLVSCDASRAKKVLIKQIVPSGKGIRILGMKVEATPSNFPILVSTGHQRIDGYVVYTAGILGTDGQTKWFWSPEQESKLHDAQKQDNDKEYDKNLIQQFFTSMNVLPTANSAAPIEKEKASALLNYDLHYQNAMREFERVHSCSDISINVHTTENIEINCPDGFNIQTIVMESAFGSNLINSARVLQRVSSLGRLYDEANSLVQLGTYDACDGFKTAK